MKYSDFIRYGEDMLGKSPDDDWRFFSGWQGAWDRKGREHKKEMMNIERDFLFGPPMPVPFANMSASVLYGDD